MSTATRTSSAEPAVLDRIAAAPISWGVCEVPGWGVQLAPELVLSEIYSLGVRSVEAGPDGYLGDDPERVRALLDANGLRLAGGFLYQFKRFGRIPAMSVDRRRANRIKRALQSQQLWPRA